MVCVFQTAAKVQSTFGKCQKECVKLACKHSFWRSRSAVSTDAVQANLCTAALESERKRALRRACGENPSTSVPPKSKSSQPLKGHPILIKNEPGIICDYLWSIAYTTKKKTKQRPPVSRYSAFPHTQCLKNNMPEIPT